MPKDQPLVPSPRNGKLRGATHGAFTLQGRVKAGHVPKNTREGRAYHDIVEHLTAFAAKRLGRELDPIILIAVEQVAADYLCQRLMFAWTMRRDADGCNGKGRKKEPLGKTPDRYFMFRRLLDKSLRQLADMLNTTPARLQGGLAGLDDLRQPIDITPGAKDE